MERRGCNQISVCCVCVCENYCDQLFLSSLPLSQISCKSKTLGELDFVGNNSYFYFIFCFVFLCYFSIAIYIQYYFVLASSVQHSVSPDIPSTHMVPHIVIRILLTMFPMLYFTSHDYSVTTNPYCSPNPPPLWQPSVCSL